MGMFLNADALRIVIRDDRGRIIKRTRYKRGDEIDFSHDEVREQSLAEDGVLVSSREAVVGLPGWTPQAVLERSGEATPEPAGASTEGMPPLDFGPDDGVEDVDKYTSMDEAELIEAAEAVEIDTDDATAEDLRNRLREHDRA